MWSGARTPEELETLFEDAWLMRDGPLLAGLLADGAVMATDAHRVPVGLLAGARALWAAGRPYVGARPRVLGSRDLALLVSPAAVHVARRDAAGDWRLAIALLHPVDPSDPRSTR